MARLSGAAASHAKQADDDQRRAARRDRQAKDAEFFRLHNLLDVFFYPGEKNAFAHEFETAKEFCGWWLTDVVRPFCKQAEAVGCRASLEGAQHLLFRRGHRFDGHALAEAFDRRASRQSPETHRRSLPHKLARVVEAAAQGGDGAVVVGGSKRERCVRAHAKVVGLALGRREPHAVG